MRIPKQFELTLESDAFNALKADFNSTLKKTLKNMQDKGSDAAEIKISLKIAFATGEQSDIQINDLDGKREIIIPRFEHKVASVLQMKEEVSGMLGGDYELVYDNSRKEYIMREIVGPQTSLDDYL